MHRFRYSIAYFDQGDCAAANIGAGENSNGGDRRCKKTAAATFPPGGRRCKKAAAATLPPGGRSCKEAAAASLPPGETG